MELPKYKTIWERQYSEAHKAFVSGNFPEAIRLLEKLYDERAEPQIAATLAVMHTQMENWIEAEIWAKGSMMLAPWSGDYVSQLGVIYMMQHNYPLAKETMDKAFKMAALSPKVNVNIGTLLIEMNKPAESLPYFDRALRYSDRKQFEAGLPEAHVNMALALMALERFDEAWSHYDFRFLTHGHSGYADFAPPWPLWRGQNLQGQIIYLRTEQGKGDTLKFCRYIHLLRGMGAEVILSCDNDMAPLMQIVFPDIAVVSGTAKVPHADYWCWLMSLGQFFKGIPNHTPYICAVLDDETLFYDLDPYKLHVGLCWHGNPDQKDDWKRSIHDEPAYWNWYSDIYASCSNVAFTSLQYGEGSAIATNPILRDWWHTAQVMEAMDLIVTVDTSIAHLAGAMGKPVIVLLSAAPAFHYPPAGPSTSWYPNMTLLRQKVMGDWSYPLQEGGRLIKSMVQNKRRRIAVEKEV